MPLHFEVEKEEERIRQGILSINTSRAVSDLQVDTPNCLMYSHRGTTPHLTPDVVRSVPIRGIQVALCQLFDEFPPLSATFEPGIHKYLNLEDYLIFVDMLDPSELEETPFNGEKYISVKTYGGMRKITPEDYLRTINAYKPDIAAALADIVVDKNPTAKRARKSVDRSLRWLDAIIAQKQESINLFGVLVGSQYDRERQRCAEEVVKRDVDGYILEARSFDVSNEEKERLLKISLDHLPRDKPRVGYGFSAPDDILTGITLGIDLFDSSFPYHATQKGLALIFEFGNQDAGSGDLTYDLNDPKNKSDQQPLLEGCRCFACQNHSRCYTHHLINTHEMLASILLMVHNCHHYSRFFQQIRESIGNGTFKQKKANFLQIYYNL
ncbi:tRNA-guanine transglycosylase [Basidiobolus meristosporus CBS 931.73]|uniref:Queuine tRNA-ribosyltransferase accessory subunit 2 n=1 Tax=Basidiobolus meristosporus CBS 931.73 TaxID=1314790 RepID=A0A1Y1Y0Z4_9FUNG|nr:tRNA-guanine transglycosylase [Basidiobolus meristosporus CBS 931.73]|eukprot:ORX91565.1 tRNA-guanine transglycosylase [Basidiobolus meristosporus CBS 931.73]